MNIFHLEFWLREITLGNVTFSPLSLTGGLILVLLLVLVQRLVIRILEHRVFPRFRIDAGLAYAYSVLLGYLFVFFGLAMILPIAVRGFNWATLSVVLGAISFGIGFGLRNITDNFVSGLIILIERPIKVGDRVAIGDMSGNVVAIRARSTSVRTNDNIDIIVPNSQFISEQVVNWSHGDRKVRFKIPVGVHYKSDVFVVRDALEAAAKEHPDVLSYPAPTAKFLAFGDSALEFELRVWTESMSDRPRAFQSDMNFLIWKYFKEREIEVPYPQRDIYIKELPQSSDPISPPGT